MRHCIGGEIIHQDATASDSSQRPNNRGLRFIFLFRRKHRRRSVIRIFLSHRSTYPFVELRMLLLFGSFAHRPTDWQPFMYGRIPSGFSQGETERNRDCREAKNSADRPDIQESLSGPSELMTPSEITARREIT